MTSRTFMKDMVRPIALAVFFGSAGFLVRLLLDVAFDIGMSLLLASVLNFGIAAFAVFILFPRGLKQPFGSVSLAEHLRRLGFYLPTGAWKHVVLGGMLALCTLAGMLVGSILTGRYEPDVSTITVSHTVFSLNAGVWEEALYRGVIMAVLLTAAASVRKAAVIQVLIFGVAHIKGVDPWSLVDVVSVMIMAAAFTYVAYKTRVLIAGIVFHILHDAFLFFVQVPGGEYAGFSEHAAFYLALWVMIGAACLITKLAAEHLGVQAKDPLYRPGVSSS